MNKAILSGELVAHVGDFKGEGELDVHQATLRTVEPFLVGKGHTEHHALVFFGQDAVTARALEPGTRVLVQAAIRWTPVPCLHVHGLEVL